MAATLLRHLAKLTRTGVPVPLKQPQRICGGTYPNTAAQIHHWNSNVQTVAYHGSKKIESEPSERQQKNQLRLQQCRFFTEDRKTTALTLFTDLKHLKSSPLPALSLGVSGLIPFLAAPAYIIYSGSYLADIAFMQAVYGATILSFLGGVRWGLTVPDESKVPPDWLNLGYSVIPPLVAWVGLLLPPVPCMFTLITGLAGAAYFDVMSWGYPPWFKALRFMLSLIAILSLWTTLTCKLIYDEKKKEESTKAESSE